MSDERRHNRELDDNRPLAELISAYLDDRASLSSEELAGVELLLDADPTARQIHAELGVIHAGLRSFDPIEAPRSYHLTAEMVGASEPIVLQETSAWYVRQAATVRWATAAAAVIFVFVLGADLVLNSVFSGPVDSNDTYQADQSEFVSRQAGEEAAKGAASTQATEDASGGDAGGGAEAPSFVTPEVTGDAADDQGVSGAAALAPASGTEEAEPLDGTANTMPMLAPEGADSSSDDSAIAESTLAFDADEASVESEASDRRLWRIAEFSLVIILGLLITALVVLPRVGGTATRSASD
jgi:hypothetical protein